MDKQYPYEAPPSRDRPPLPALPSRKAPLAVGLSLIALAALLTTADVWTAVMDGVPPRGALAIIKLWLGLDLTLAGMWVAFESRSAAWILAVNVSIGAALAFVYWS
jgi:hypothetical protein